MFILFLLSAAVLLVYDFHFYAQLKREPEAREPHQWPLITVLTCARNEADSLPQLFKALENQSYPAFQWVVVNDESTDGTQAWLQSMSSEPSRLDVTPIHLKDKALAGKKGAVLAGWEVCKHDIIVSIDADCLPVSEDWLREVVRAMNGGAEVFIGLGQYKSSSGLLSNLIQLETLQTAMLYLSSARVGRPYMAVGRNWAYRKWASMEEDLLADAGILSGDDDLLLQRRKPQKVAIRWKKEAQTESVPPQSWSSWIAQKRRHASTGMGYPLRDQAYLFLFVAAQAGFIFGLFGSILQGAPTGIMALLFGSFLMLEWLLIYPFFRTVGKTSVLWKRWYLVPLLLLFMFLYGVLGLLKPSKWSSSE